MLAQIGNWYNIIIELTTAPTNIPGNEKKFKSLMMEGIDTPNSGSTQEQENVDDKSSVAEISHIAPREECQEQWREESSRKIRPQINNSTLRKTILYRTLTAALVLNLALALFLHLSAGSNSLIDPQSGTEPAYKMFAPRASATLDVLSKPIPAAQQSSQLSDLFATGLDLYGTGPAYLED